MSSQPSKITAIIFCIAAYTLISVPAGAADPPPADSAVVAGKAEPLLRGPLTQTLGNPNGEVTIIEFFDYACPGCKAIEPKLQALPKADPRVRLVMTAFPILGPQSLTATKAATAAARA